MALYITHLGSRCTTPGHTLSIESEGILTWCSASWDESYIMEHFFLLHGKYPSIGHRLKNDLCGRLLKLLCSRDVFIYLFKTDQQRERKRRRNIYICWFTTEMVTIARVEPSQTQQPPGWIHLDLPQGRQELKLLEPSSTAFQGTVSGCWIRSRPAETSTSALKWEASVASGGLTCCTTMLAPDFWISLVYSRVYVSCRIYNLLVIACSFGPTNNLKFFTEFSR